VKRVYFLNVIFTGGQAKNTHHLITFVYVVDEVKLTRSLPNVHLNLIT